MPQITLKLSNNIAINHIDFHSIFAAIHSELGKIHGLDVCSCHSGVLQEEYSYIGYGDLKATKIYLEVLWLETAERSKLKVKLAQSLMNVLDIILVPQIVKQGLTCLPRVRIGHLGIINQDYHIMVQ